MVLVLSVAACSAEGDAAPVELLVSAATSLSEVLGEAAIVYQEQHPGVRVLENFGASGALEQQIRRGATVDIFVSAGTREMDALERGGLVRPETRRVLVGNELVLAVPARRGGGVRGFADLPRAERIAMGAPASVPAGAYALASLRAQGLWGSVERKMVYTADVRQALAYAERGEVDAALIYRTDALRTGGVRVVEVAPRGKHPPIVYPAAVTNGSRHAGEATRYLDFLAGPEAAAIFRRHGFAPPPRAAESGDRTP